MVLEAKSGKGSTEGIWVESEADVIWRPGQDTYPASE